MGALIFLYFRLFNACLNLISGCGGRILGEFLGIIQHKNPQNGNWLESSASCLEPRNNWRESSASCLVSRNNWRESSASCLEPRNNWRESSASWRESGNGWHETGNSGIFKDKNLKFDINNY